MQAPLIEAVWLDDSQEVTFTELCDCSGLSANEVRELVELGAIVPVEVHATDWSFNARWLVAARTANRLRAHFELDTEGLALVLGLLDRIRDLQAVLQATEARLPGRVHRN
jgi:chaperone modulatory protein CbpM